MLNGQSSISPSPTHRELQARVGFDNLAVAAFCRVNHIRRMALFGSVLRDDFSPESDIDVLVEFEPGAKVGLFDMGRMVEALDNVFGREVDLLTAGFLSPYFRQRVLEEAVPIYEIIT